MEKIKSWFSNHNIFIYIVGFLIIMGSIGLFDNLIGKRYQKFYLSGGETCWRVEAIDWLSTPGVLEVVAVEYYANETEDDIDNGIVGGLIEEIKDPNPEEESGIVGETFIKLKKSYSYTFSGPAAASWFVDAKYPVKLEIDPEDPKNVSLTWTAGYSGQFDLYYGEYKKAIVVESLF